MTMLQPAISRDFLNYMETGSAQAWGVHDCYGRAFYMNEHSRQLSGLPRHYDICGRHFSELPAPIFFSCADKVVAQNEICITQQREIRVLNVHPGGDGWFAYMSKKLPHYNLQGEVDGVLSAGYSVTRSWMHAAHNIRCLMKVDQRAMRGQISLNVGHLPCLSPRESEVLFFLLCNQQIKQIAGILSLSENTVRTHIEHLKKKFGVHSIAQLIEAAIAVGCHDFLPETLRLRQLSMIVEN